MVPIRCLGKIQNHTLNTSIAVALAIFTQSVPDMEVLKYSDESCWSCDFHYLLCASLSTILRFPEYFKSTDIVTLVQDKFVAASLGLLAQPANDNEHYHTIIAEIFKFTFSSEQPLHHDLVIALSKIEPQVYLHLHSGAIPDATRYFVESTPIEVQIAIGVCLENLNAPTPSLVGALLDQNSELIRCVVSSNMTMDARSKAFKLLLKKVHRSQVDNNQNQWHKLKLQGFFEAVQVFFAFIGCINHSELGIWMDTLHLLCNREGTALCQSGAMQAFIVWAYQDWRGRLMTQMHLPDISMMAQKLSLSVEDINDTSWFSASSVPKLYQARM
ncbi:hypothetical protein C8R47DRAFT_1167768 [Mycena vitilis]|nr:hypothetical protein C8R47DRAFT_1167768 [Mycena vitilis]